MRTMTRASPQTDRIVMVMDLLMAEPGRGRTLADMARHLGVAKATCYPMVVALTRAGWLVRHPRHKTYQLGPALVPLGRAAASAIDVVDHARDALHELADSTGMVCLGYVPSRNDLVVAELIQPADGRRASLGLRIGDRIDFAPPLGAVAAASSPDEALDDWYHRGESALGIPAADLKAVYSPALELIRERGYAVEHLSGDAASISDVVSQRRGQHPLALHHLAAGPALAELTGNPVADVLVREIQQDALYRVVTISALVFNPDLTPALVVCIVDAPVPIPGIRVSELGDIVRDTAARITTTIGGVQSIGQS